MTNKHSSAAGIPSAGNDASAFWRFSLRFYALPRVAPACLELQESAGVDVNIMLYLLYVAKQGRLVASENVARIDALIGAWREQVVLPLRALRRVLKDGIGPIGAAAAAKLRTEVKRIELESERIEQEFIERLAPVASLGVQAPSLGEAARANLAAYGALLGGLPESPIAILLEAFAGTLNNDWPLMNTDESG